MDQPVKWVFLTMLALRLSQLFLDYNYDRADQYWQGSEVAYQLSHGYGYLSWEWTMQEPIRSPIYQLYLKLGYSFCQLTNCNAYLTEIAPKVMQLFLSLLCDWYLLKTVTYYVRSVSYLVCLCLLTNWYYFSMLNRIYINSAETCLALIAFYYWTTRKDHPIHDYISRLIVILNFSLRPTSLFLWVIIWPYELLTKKEGKIMFIFKNALQLVAIGLFSFLVGSLWYGKWIWIDYNFFKYNVFYKFSELYGVNSFFQYFYLVVPFMMTSYLVPLVIAGKENWGGLRALLSGKKQKRQEEQDNQEESEGKVQIVQEWENQKYWELCLLTLGILLFLSLSAHKEPRFLLVLTPMLLILSIKGFQKIENNKPVLLIIIAINIFFFATLSLGTKTGGTDVLRDLRQQIDKFPVEQHPSLMVMYLCEPHSLPLMTIIQRNIDFRIIDTSPFRKLENFNEEVELMANPLQLYNQLSRGQDPTFAIIQQKYSMKGAHINEAYSFLLNKGYQMVSVHRNVNIFEETFAGWDGFVLLKKG